MSHRPPPIIGFCGASNSGKTTLVAQVIENLCARGLALGAIKHHGHPEPLQAPSRGGHPKDSERLAQAGARRVALSHAGGIWLSAGPQEAHQDPKQIAASYMGGLELVVVEGYKTASIPKIEVVAPGAQALLPPGGELLALARRGGGRPGPDGLTVLNADDPQEVSQFVLDYFKLI